MATKRISWKFGSMRKPDDYIVLPPAAKEGDEQNSKIIIQGSRSIGMFDPVTRHGVLNYKGSNPKYFMHLNHFMGAEETDFPELFVQMCVDCMPLPGDAIVDGIAYHGTTTII